MLWRVFDELTATYTDRKIAPFEPLPGVEGQYIDAFGKVRKILLPEGVLDCTPIPPMDVPVYTKEELDAVDPPSGDAIRALRLYIQRNARPTLTLPRVGISDLDIYRFNERLSRVLKGWALRMLSEYLSAAEDSEESIVEAFMQDRVILIPSEDYYIASDEAFDYTFDPDSNRLLFRAGKLVCNSQELYDNLAYYLKLELQRRPQIVRAYRDLSVNPQYFIYAYDYMPRDNTVITEYVPQGAGDSIQELFKPKTAALHSRIQQRVKSFYYLVKGGAEGGGTPRVILTRAADTINKALQILLSNRYPDGNIPFEYNTLQIPFYLYSNSFNDVQIMNPEAGAPVFEVYQEGQTYLPIL